METYLRLYTGTAFQKERLFRRIKNRIVSFLEGAETADQSDGLKVVTGALSRERIDENAGRMLDMYGDSILRLSYSYLHNMSDAEDVVQETLIKYMKTGPVFESESHEKAWLMRVAANISKNKIEYNRVRQSDELNETLVAEEREDLAFVWEAVKSLPDKYRDVIHLFYHEGYSTTEIASILRRNESTVRSDLKRGREKLKFVLKEVYDFD